MYGGREEDLTAKDVRVRNKKYTPTNIATDEHKKKR